MSVKVKSIIISIVLIVVFAGVGIGLYCAWPAINGTITNSKYYTSQDIQDAYDKGVEDTLKNKDELQEQVDYYRILIEENTITINGLKEQVRVLENENQNLGSTNGSLNETISSLQGQVSNLNETIKTNETTITNLNDEKERLNVQIEELTANNNSNTEIINSLNERISNLETQISDLNKTNSQLQATINSLNSTIAILNNEVSTYEERVTALNTQIVNLQNSISTYEQSITNYEQIIEDLKKINACVVTFTVDGELYNTQQVNKTESPIEIENPASENYVFEGWVIKGSSEVVNPFTYSVVEDIEFVAKISMYLTVNFSVNDEIIASQQVLSGECPENVIVNNTEDYVFDYWTVDDLKIENILGYKITKTTTFKARLRYYYLVTYMNGAEELSSEKVLSGNKCINIPNVTISEGITYLKGWSIDEINLINPLEYVITENVTIHAIIDFEQVSVSNFEEANDLGLKNYYIYNSSDLQTLSALVQSGNHLSGYSFYQNCDIDMVNVPFVPIGYSSQLYFSGSYYGQGYELKNLSFAENMDFGTYGLFGYVYLSKSYFNDIHVRYNSQINKDISCFGGIIGCIAGYYSSGIGVTYNAYAYADCVINCSTSGNFKSSKIISDAGGIIGCAGRLFGLKDDYFVNSCYSSINIESLYGRTGGIIGSVYVSQSTNTNLVINCYFNGSLKYTSYSFGKGCSIGGILGAINNDTKHNYYSSIINSYFSGEITNKVNSSMYDYAPAGGIIGCSNVNLNIENCFASGIINSDIKETAEIKWCDIGGIIGCLSTVGNKDNNLVIKNCYTCFNTSSPVVDAIIGTIRCYNGSYSAVDYTKTKNITINNVSYSKNQTLITKALQDESLSEESFKNKDFALYNNWDFENIWELKVNNFPTFKVV